MNRETLLSLYERLTSVVEKLPGGLQKPILSELVPIRQLFLEQRPARLVLLGDGAMSVPELLSRCFGVQVETGETDGCWRSYRVPQRGAITILDARHDTPQAIFESGMTRLTPDAALVIRTAAPNDPVVLELTDIRLAACPATLPTLGIAFGGEAARARLAAQLAKRRGSPRATALSPDCRDPIAETLCALLPNAAKLEFARITAAKGAQAEIAGSLMKSFAAVCGVVAMQPIPLADMPVLTTLQTLMVGLVIYTSGKPASPRMMAEFLGALGINIGAAFVFRESARALVKILPFWGSAISGFVAGAGTYAIGRAAIAYFIHETPAAETRKIFRKLLPDRKHPHTQPPPLP